jgi:hypothetical protein
MTANEQATKFILALDEAEHTELLKVLERELRETHAEARRTESPDFQEEVHHEESILVSLVEKLRRE